MQAEQCGKGRVVYLEQTQQAGLTNCFKILSIGQCQAGQGRVQLGLGRVWPARSEQNCNQRRAKLSIAGQLPVGAAIKLLACCPTELWPMLIGRTSSVNMRESPRGRPAATNCCNNEILTKFNSDTESGTTKVVALGRDIMCCLVCLTIHTRVHVCVYVCLQFSQLSRLLGLCALLAAILACLLAAPENRLETAGKWTARGVPVGHNRQWQRQIQLQQQLPLARVYSPKDTDIPSDDIDRGTESGREVVVSRGSECQPDKR